VLSLHPRRISTHATDLPDAKNGFPKRKLLELAWGWCGAESDEPTYVSLPSLHAHLKCAAATCRKMLESSIVCVRSEAWGQASRECV
ncbi:hypothetical protein AVEN_92034-2-1, partial [Araneus ventricosus]